MLDNEFLSDLSKRLYALLSAVLPMAEEISGELRTKIEQQLKKSFAKLDLLSREEFDAQSKALARAEQRLQDLAATIETLESKLRAIEEDSPDN